MDDIQCALTNSGALNFNSEFGTFTIDMGKTPFPEEFTIHPGNKHLHLDLRWGGQGRIGEISPGHKISLITVEGQRYDAVRVAVDTVIGGKEATLELYIPRLWGDRDTLWVDDKGRLLYRHLGLVDLPVECRHVTTGESVLLVDATVNLRLTSGYPRLTTTLKPQRMELVVSQQAGMMVFPPKKNPGVYEYDQDRFRPVRVKLAAWDYLQSLGGGKK